MRLMVKEAETRMVRGDGEGRMRIEERSWAQDDTHKWRRLGRFFYPEAEAGKPGVVAEPGSLGAGEISKGEVRA